MTPSPPAAVMWAFGGPLVVEASDDGSSRGNHRLAFHNVLTQIGSAIKLPKDGGEGEPA